MIWSKICQSWQAEWWILFDILFSVLHGRERWTSLPGNISPFCTFGDFLSFVAATVLMVWRNVESTSGSTSHGCHQFSRRASQCKKKFLWYSISIFLYIWYLWGNTFGNISAIFFLPRECGLCKCRLEDNCTCIASHICNVDCTDTCTSTCTCLWTSSGCRRRHFGECHPELRQQFSVAK